ncbi:hypothetical protein ACHAW6_002614 [Cyclotella cf. meneghiniana]
MFIISMPLPASLSSPPGLMQLKLGTLPAGLVSLMPTHQNFSLPVMKPQPAWSTFVPSPKIGKLPTNSYLQTFTTATLPNVPSKPSKPTSSPFWLASVNPSPTTSGISSSLKPSLHSIFSDNQVSPPLCRLGITTTIRLSTLTPHHLVLAAALSSFTTDPTNEPLGHSTDETASTLVQPYLTTAASKLSMQTPGLSSSPIL